MSTSQQIIVLTLNSVHSSGELEHTGNHDTSSKKQDLDEQIDLKTKSVYDSFVSSGLVPSGCDRARQ